MITLFLVYYANIKHLTNKEIITNLSPKVNSQTGMEKEQFD